MEDPVCRHIITWQDGQTQPLFDSIYKLEALETSSTQNIRDSLGLIVDMVYNQGACPGEFAVRQISGKGLAGGKGNIDMILAKKELSKSLKTYATERSAPSSLCRSSGRGRMASTSTGGTCGTGLRHTPQ